MSKNYDLVILQVQNDETLQSFAELLRPYIAEVARQEFHKVFAQAKDPFEGEPYREIAAFWAKKLGISRRTFLTRVVTYRLNPIIEEGRTFYLREEVRRFLQPSK